MLRVIEKRGKGPTAWLVLCLLFLQVPSWVAAALDPSVTLAFLDTDAIQPAAAAEDSLAPGGGVVNLGEETLPVTF